MKRFKFYYEVKRDLEVGEEIIMARTKREAEEFFNDMAEAEPEALAHQAGCPTPDYCKIKLTNITELDDKS